MKVSAAVLASLFVRGVPAVWPRFLSVVVGSLLAVSAARADLIALSIAADDPTGTSAVTAKLIGAAGPGSVQLPITSDITGLVSGSAEANGTVLRPNSERCSIGQCHARLWLARSESNDRHLE
jgi:hypothetical protein